MAVTKRKHKRPIPVTTVQSALTALQLEPVAYRWRYHTYEKTWTKWIFMHAEDVAGFRQVQHKNLTIGLVQLQALYLKEET